MMCEDCKKRAATVNFTQVVNNQKVTLNLCSVCAKRRGFSNPLKNMPFPLADFLSSMVPASSRGRSELAAHRCSYCGLSYEEFAKTGRLGCGECFSVFRQPLSELLRKIHGSNMHRGKRLGVSGASMEPLKEEARLKDELKQAIEREDFERAAVLRDMLKDVQRKIVEMSNA